MNLTHCGPSIYHLKFNCLIKSSIYVLSAYTCNAALKEKLVLEKTNCWVWKRYCKSIKCGKTKKCKAVTKKKRMMCLFGKGKIT